MTDWLIGAAAVLLTVVGASDEDPSCWRLGQLDAIRVAAFMQDDPALLQEVHAFQEGVAADRALLKGYTERGLFLRGGALQRQECRLLEGDDELLVLDVVDRLGPTYVVDERGHRRALPRPAAQRRTVELVRTDAGWRIGAVS